MVTEKTKKKMSKNNGRYWLGKKRPEISQMMKGNAYGCGCIPWNKNLTKETDERVKEYGKKGSKSKKGQPSPRKGIEMSKNQKQKIGEANKGKIWTIEERENLSKGQIKRWDKIGRKKYKRYIHQTATKKYKKWRMSVFIRDNFICQECGKTNCYLEAHHKKSWAKYPELRFEVSNGLTLCKDCHNHTGNELKLNCLEYA